jgi:hypothetical protein
MNTIFACQAVAPHLLEYASGHLTPQDEERVQQHLNHCASCRRDAENYRQALALAHKAQQQPFPASQTNWQTLRMRLVQEQTAPTLPRRTVSPRFAWMLAGTAVMGLVGVVLWKPRPDKHPATLPVAVHITAPAPLYIATLSPSAVRSDVRKTQSGLRSVVAQEIVTKQTSAMRKPSAQRMPIAPMPRNTLGQRRVEALVQQTPLPSSTPDDLTYLNGNVERSVGLAYVSPAKTYALQTELAQMLADVQRGDAWVTLAIPQIAGQGAGAVRAALVAYKQQAAIVDTRLARKVRLGVKDIALSALCQRLADETGIAISTDARTADENVTLFCHPRPLRDILRQLSDHFGFQWLREGQEGAYRYELTRSVRSQLLEEELRNQDQDEALIALDQAMEKYRKFRGLNTSQVRALLPTFKGDDAGLLFPLESGGWLPANLYFGLSQDDMQTLRSGQPLRYGLSPQNSERALPAALGPEILNAFDNVMIDPTGNTRSHDIPPGSLPLSAAKEIGITSELRLDRSQLGEFTLRGDVFLKVTAPNGTQDGIGHGITLAQVTSPATGSPQNALANAKYAHDADMLAHVSITPKASCKLALQGEVADVEGIGSEAGAKATTGDVLEAVYKATGKDLIGDAYTHLYSPGKLTESDVTLFAALNRIGDKMRERWTKADGWLKFRSASWFYDRPKEVPARQLTRWAASRKEHGALTLDDLSEIASLSNVQLDALTTYQGALARYDLQEWNFARSSNLRDHWRFLGVVPADLRRGVATEAGLQCDRLPLPLQKRFIALALHDQDTDVRPGDRRVAKASLRIEYPQAHHPADKPERNSLLMGNPIVFYYKYGEPEKDFGQRTDVIGPFNAVIGGSEAMSEQMRKDR